MPPQIVPFALQEEADGLAEPAAETSVKMYSVGAKIVPLELKAVLGGDCKERSKYIARIVTGVGDQV